MRVTAQAVSHYRSILLRNSFEDVNAAISLPNNDFVRLHIYLFA